MFFYIIIVIAINIIIIVVIVASLFLFFSASASSSSRCRSLIFRAFYANFFWQPPFPHVSFSLCTLRVMSSACAPWECLGYKKRAFATHIIYTAICRFIVIKVNVHTS